MIVYNLWIRNPFVVDANKRRIFGECTGFLTIVTESGTNSLNVRTALLILFLTLLHLALCFRKGVEILLNRNIYPRIPKTLRHKGMKAMESMMYADTRT